jgi:deferrochelatase/peroxidase EfeB
MATAPQTGILNRPPEHETLVAFRFAGARDPNSCRNTVEALRGVLRRELHSDLDEITPATDKTVPFAETGELGFVDGFDRAHLTVTVAFSASAYDAFGTPAEQRPQDLAPAPFADLAITPTIADTGDILLQINTDNAYVAEHVQRRVEHSLAGQLELVWAINGNQRYTSRAGRANTAEARALNGFLDGTSNLDPAHSDDDYALVFVDPAKVGSYPPNPPAGAQPGPQPGQPGYGQPGGSGPIFPQLRTVPTREPDWTHDGTYLFVQAVVTDTATWDNTALQSQEQVIGRFKRSGASLDLADDDAQRDVPPAFATNPSAAGVDVTSHIRKSNPRALPEDQLRRIFRRGYPLVIADGAVRRGLIFQSYSRTTSTQIEFILKAWMFNNDFPTPGVGKDRLLAFFANTICGGYYFVPPLDHAHDSTSWRIP